MTVVVTARDVLSTAIWVLSVLVVMFAFPLASRLAAWCFIGLRAFPWLLGTFSRAFPTARGSPHAGPRGEAGKTLAGRS